MSHLIKLTAERLREVLEYDPLTGEFLTRCRRGSSPRGVVAGSIHVPKRKRTAYRRIAVDGRRYFAHQLAWLYVHNHWPIGIIDHIDGDGLNNRVTNLREVTCSQNLRNRRVSRTNTSGVTGVYWDGQRNKWEARIGVDGKSRYVGRFSTKAEAIGARLAAMVVHHGEFASA